MTDNNNVGGNIPADNPKQKFDAVKYKNEYTRQNYDRIGLIIPKKRGETWRALAAAEGKSVNAFIRDAVEKYIATDFPKSRLLDE